MRVERAQHRPHHDAPGAWRAAARPTPRRAARPRRTRRPRAVLDLLGGAGEVRRAVLARGGVEPDARPAATSRGRRACRRTESRRARRRTAWRRPCSAPGSAARGPGPGRRRRTRRASSASAAVKKRIGGTLLDPLEHDPPGHLVPVVGLVEHVVVGIAAVHLRRDAVALARQLVGRGGLPVRAEVRQVLGAAKVAAPSALAPERGRGQAHAADQRQRAGREQRRPHHDVEQRLVEARRACARRRARA